MSKEGGRQGGERVQNLVARRERKEVLEEEEEEEESRERETLNATFCVF